MAITQQAAWVLWDPHGLSVLRWVTCKVLMKKGPCKIMMVSPDSFRVEYAINPHMRTPTGELNVVNRARAFEQWQELKEVYEKLGFEVLVLPSAWQFPDMVFCANQTFSFMNHQGEPSVLLSRMHFSHRQGEVKYFAQELSARGYRIYQTPELAVDFEGSGDALWDHEREIVFGGFGFRTSESVYRHLSSLIKTPMKLLKLADPRFYHLDTCLSILNKETAVFVPEAFDSEGLLLLKESFKNLLAADIHESIHFFAANCHSPDGKNVLIQKGADKLVAKLRKTGFEVIEVDTSEFIKSGGSVFCMKQMLY